MHATFRERFSLRPDGRKACVQRGDAASGRKDLNLIPTRPLLDSEAELCTMQYIIPPCGEGADAIRHELNSRRAAVEDGLRRCLIRAKAEGDLPPDANPADLARYVVTTIRGMAVQAAGAQAVMSCGALFGWRSERGPREKRRVAKIGIFTCLFKLKVKLCMT